MRSHEIMDWLAKNGYQMSYGGSGVELVISDKKTRELFIIRLPKDEPEDYLEMMMEEAMYLCKQHILDTKINSIIDGSE